MNNFSNSKPNNPHSFKEEIKISDNAVLAVVEKFLNGTGAMMELLKAEPTPLPCANYYAMPVSDQAMWEERGDAVTQVMLFLLSSKNNNAKKGLCLAYSQGNKSAYPLTAKVMASICQHNIPTRT